MVTTIWNIRAILYTRAVAPLQPKTPPSRLKAIRTHWYQLKLFFGGKLGGS